MRSERGRTSTTGSISTTDEVASTVPSNLPSPSMLFSSVELIVLEQVKVFGEESGKASATRTKGARGRDTAAERGHAGGHDERDESGDELGDELAASEAAKLNRASRG